MRFAARGLQPGKAKKLANFLGLEVKDLLAPWDPLYVPPKEPPGPWSGQAEWKPVGYLNQGRLAPNGLYYIVCRMQHRHTSGKWGRGKFYHLSWLRADERADKRHQLSRHPDVCARVAAHPNIVVNFSSTPIAHDEGWWVVDDWVGETTLADCLRQQPWPRDKLARLLLEIARGLEALHRADVVFRELAPARVLIADKDQRAVLTDFELAKLLDGGPSVSSEWPEDVFRAPEVEGGTVTVQADLYSLGQVAAAAVAGGPLSTRVRATTSSQIRSREILERAGLPKRANRLLLDCLEPVPDRRPSSLAPVLQELARWAEK